ncbi:MAG: aminopeptidase P family protein [Alphaproteobacteria bacterium]|nr:aminopeptidase P family protein [Alphaproteobacteria bacterium]MCB9930754.1 aminopeptidase P family protein [Alphaproteobacteria bacterium]
MSATHLPAPIKVRLADALAASRNAVALQDALEILEGLAGAPASGLAADPTYWTRLFAPSPTAELQAALAAARQALATASPVRGLPLSDRLPALRRTLAERGLDGFVIPHGDEHQSEFVPAANARLGWLTGFIGSAGIAIVLADKAAIFVDGRYTLQVRDQVDTAAFETLHVTENPPTEWVARNLPAGAVLGLDPWLHGADAADGYEKAATKAGGRLQPVEGNPIDAIWTDRPAAPLAPIIPHPENFSGETSESKRQRLAAKLTAGNADATVLSQPDSIAWLLNVRGGDTAHTPLPLSFALLHADGRVDWFCDGRKLLPETRTHIGNGVRVQAPQSLGPALDRLGAEGKAVQADRRSTPVWVQRRLTEAGAILTDAPDPCVDPRAAKNAVELEGSRQAHRRDAVAMARFLAWIDEYGPLGTVGEVEAADRLLAFRQQVAGFRDQSFPTISGFGPNGAIVHYHATSETERMLKPDSLYLVDSGGQYPDGTTDITRTVVIGESSPVMRRAFTRVLQGHIGLATARFPTGTTGAQLDALARAPLWNDGLDFDHGTGHGVGSYLGVHEGPQRVAKSGATALVPGMIVSNEPGYYKAGAFGIRTENLLVVREAEGVGQDGRKFLEFETITLAPIDRRLVEVSLLTQVERAWLNDYHNRVMAEVGPDLDVATRAWLERATAPL